MEDLLSGTDSLGAERARLYGKFAGTVQDNADPLHLGRLKVLVPEVMGDEVIEWAEPCVPYAGPNSGFFSVPPEGAGVWVEFAGGDASRPIWTGCYWIEGMLTMKPPGGPSAPKSRIWRTEDGLTAMLDDEAKTMTLTDADGTNLVEINADSGTVTIKAKKVVIEADKVMLTEESPSEKGVLGKALVDYLNSVVRTFSSHTHPVPGVGASGPPVPPPMDMPNQSNLLSTKVKLA